MNAFLKIAYQPYKWLVVIPFVFFITMLLGLICIVVGFVFSQDAADILAVTWSRLCCAIAPLLHFTPLRPPVCCCYFTPQKKSITITH